MLDNRWGCQSGCRNALHALEMLRRTPIHRNVGMDAEKCGSVYDRDMRVSNLNHEVISKVHHQVLLEGVSIYT